jgi:hypothetical protein
MRRLLPLLACALVLSMLGGAGAAGIDWKSLPNFDYYNQRLRLSTDSTWGGAHVVDAGKFLNFQPDTSWPKLKRQWLWSASCGQQAQRVVFTKTFLAPGVPVSGNLNLYYGPGNQFLGNRPYESAVYEINGIEIGRLGNTARFPKKFAPELSAALSARALHAFRHGQNRATIRVDRAQLKKGDPCTHPNSPKVGGNVRYIAVLADLSLLFGADLRAVAPQTPQQVQHVTNGQTVSLQGVPSFANDGPSTSLGGTVQLSAGGDGQTILVEPMTHGVAPLTDCKLEQTRITCTYPELRAGARTSINVTAAMKVNIGFFQNGVGKLTIQWSITRPGLDPNGANNTAQTVAILCAPGATVAPCS